MEHHFIQRDLHKRRMHKRQSGGLFPLADPEPDTDTPTRGVTPPNQTTTPIVRGPTSTPEEPTRATPTPPANTPTTPTPVVPANPATHTTSSSSSVTPLIPIPSLSLSIPGLSLPTTSSTTSSSSSSSSSSTSRSTSTFTQTRNIATNNAETLTVTSTSGSSSTGTGLAASATTSPAPSSGNTGAIVGGVFGAIVGIACLACVIAFVVRRLRQRRMEEEHFDAAQFRDSAMVIEDDDYPSNHMGPSANSQTYNNVSRNYGARPPTMIERHMANTPSLPPSAYGPYGATSQFNQYPEYGIDHQQPYPPMPVHDMASNYPNPFVPVDPMMAQGMYHQQQGYGYENQMQQPYQQQYADMDRVATPGRTLSPPTPAGSPPGRTPSPPTPAGSPPAPAPAASHPTALMPGQTSPVQGNAPVAPPAAAHAAAPAADKRPETVYDPEDAYGGM